MNSESGAYGPILSSSRVEQHPLSTLRNQTRAITFVSLADLSKQGLWGVIYCSGPSTLHQGKIMRCQRLLGLDQHSLTVSSGDCVSHLVGYGRAFMASTLSRMAGIILLQVCLGTELRAQPPTLAIPDSVSCEQCNIEPVHVVRIGAREGRGFLPSLPVAVKVGAGGNYWLLFPPGIPPMVFGSDGGFLLKLENHSGEPAGFGVIREVIQVPGDSTLVIEARGRAFLFDSDLEYVREIRLPGFDVMGANVLQWPQAVVFNAVVAMPLSIGWPLHTVRMDAGDATIVRSFGLNRGELRPGPGHRQTLHRLLLSRPDGQYWAVSRNEYSLTVWDSTSTALATLQRSPTWFPGISPMSPGGRERAPDPFIAGVARHGEASLWVFSAIPGEEFELAWTNIPRDASGELPASLVDFAKLYKTRIDLVDVSQVRVDATIDYPAPIISALSEDRFAVDASEHGTRYVSIFELRVTRDQ